MRELYPIGTLLDVFYDPNNLKLAYVQNYYGGKNGFFGWNLLVR